MRLRFQGKFMDKGLNNRIRLIRLSKGLSQENISSELGISVGAYSNIETGKTDITFTRLKEIAKILKTDVGVIVDLATENGNKSVREPVTGYQSIRKLEEKNNQLELLLEEKEKEIAYLKEIISLIKKGKKQGSSFRKGKK